MIEEKGKWRNDIWYAMIWEREREREREKKKYIMMGSIKQKLVYRKQTIQYTYVCMYVCMYVCTWHIIIVGKIKKKNSAKVYMYLKWYIFI